MSCRTSAWALSPGSGQERRGSGWKPVELAAMIAGFVLFWPVGLAILAWKGWKEGWWGRSNRWQAAGANGAAFNCGPWKSEGPRWARHELRRDSGNVAFEDYKTSEIERLEAEYRRLVEEQQAFGEFLAELRKAKDKAEFDQFLASRRAAPAKPAGDQDPGAGPSGI
jgi:hypothetical protein